MVRVGRQNDCGPSLYSGNPGKSTTTTSPAFNKVIFLRVFRGEQPAEYAVISRVSCSFQASQTSTTLCGGISFKISVASRNRSDGGSGLMDSW